MPLRNYTLTLTPGGWVRGTSPKFWDPLFISATIEASNLKFGTQVGFGEYVTITALSTKLVRDWLFYRSTSKIVQTSYHVPYMVPCILNHVTAAEM